MSEYGIKIKNYEAGSIHGVDLGVRTAYDCKDAMLTNSLFLDWLKDNGLNIHKGESTRDVICINFRYGTRSYEEEIRNIKKVGREHRLVRKLAYASRDKGRILYLFFDYQTKSWIEVTATPLLQPSFFNAKKW